jgi:hypothetical protein
MRKPLEIPPLTAEEVEALEKPYRTTKDVRLRTRAQIVPTFWRANGSFAITKDDHILYVFQ